MMAQPTLPEAEVGVAPLPIAPLPVADQQVGFWLKTRCFSLVTSTRLLHSPPPSYSPKPVLQVIGGTRLVVLPCNREAALACEHTGDDKTEYTCEGVRELFSQSDCKMHLLAVGQFDLGCTTCWDARGVPVSDKACGWRPSSSLPRWLQCPVGTSNATARTPKPPTSHQHT